MGVEIGLQQVGTTAWLRWWDKSGNLLLTGDERAIKSEAIANQATFAQQQAEAIADQERQQKLLERQQKEKLANYLKSIGIDPDAI
jgi:hypothetical protein